MSTIIDVSQILIYIRQHPTHYYGYMGVLSYAIKLLFERKLKYMGKIVLSNTQENTTGNQVDTWIAPIKNVKSNLLELKKEIQTNLQQEKYNQLKAKIMVDKIDLNADFEAQFALFEKEMDYIAEQKFDAFAHTHTQDIQDIINTSDEQQRKQKLTTLSQKFANTLFAETDLYFDNIKNLAGDKFKIEINDLRTQVNTSSLKTDITSPSSPDNSPFFDVPANQTSKEKEPYTMVSDYVDGYRSWDVAILNKGYEIENIYKDDKPRNLRKVMERIFDDEEKKEIRKGTFNINLSKEDGLAGIIIALRKAVTYKDLDNDNDPNYKYKQIYDGINGLSQDDNTGEISIGGNEKTLKKNIKDLIDNNLITYQRKGGLDDEINKIVKILTRAKRKDLDTFASLVQSKDDIEMTVKEWNNALEITGQSREDNLKKKEKQGYPRESKINEDNVFAFLCDFNGDGQLSAEYQKKYNIQQKNQGDVGTLFGQQVMWTIEQAIATKDVELGEGKGEQLVISNIIHNMNITDQRIHTNTLFNTMLTNPSECTKDNLVKLINGYEDEESNSIPGMPEMKIFFLDAIKKINGGSQEVTPDLYETLVGDDTELLAKLDTTKEQIKAEIDNRLTKVKNMNDTEQQALRQLIQTQGIVRVRETIFTSIMRALDNVTITTNDGAQTTLQMAGVSKSRELKSVKNEILQETVKTLAGGGIHFSATDGLRITLGIGQVGKSTSGRTTWNRQAGPGIIVGPQGVDVYIGLNGEIAEQYNYTKVINADLSQVKSAKYLGLEAGAGASAGTSGIGVEASAGINRQKDPETGINQLNEQYEKISAEIFNINDMNVNDLHDQTKLQKFLYDQINSYTGDGYKNFVSTNKQHLRDNVDFIIRYMDAHGFFGNQGKIKLLDKSNKKTAINALLEILQSGNIEQRRHDVIAGLHGKLSLTKLSFGVTTNALTLQTRKGKGNTTDETPQADVTVGQGIDAGSMIAGTGGAETQREQDRFGIFGIYVGLRLSTWRNMYVPNDQQYLYTQYEMGQGLDIDYLKSPFSDLNKYAKYLTAFYHDSRLNFTTDFASNKLIVTFTPDNKTPKDLTLARFLNLHATTEAEKNFSLEGNKLIIGNVGDIGTYTVTEAKGIRRILCLGTNKLDDAHRVTKDNVVSTIEQVTDRMTGYKALTQDKLTHDFINKLTGQNTQKIEEVKKDVSQFFTDGKVKVPEDLKKTTTLIPSDLESKELKFGTLIITKNTDLTYRISLIDYPTDKFTLKYIDNKEHEKAKTEAEKIDANRKSVQVFNGTTDKFFEYESASELYKVQSLLSTLEGDIKDLEKDENKKSKPDYLEYLSAASNVLDDQYINNTEITKALGYLKTLLEGSKVTNIDNLITYMKSDDRYTKTYIVDRLKQIFAKEGWYSGKNIAQILTNHRPGWEKLTGPSNNIIPQNVLNEVKQQRDIWAKSTTTYYNDSPDVIPNLMGYTAFYRNYGSQYKNVKFSMTSLGNTTSQVKLYNISNSNKAAAEKWFLENFQKNEKEVEYFAKTLENKIASKGESVPIFVEGDYHKTRGNIKKIMNGEPIDSGEKIIIERNMVFYLLGECCNESIGMEIVNVSIASLNPNVVDKLPGRYTATGESEKIYENGMNIYSKSHSITSKVIAQEEKVSLIHHHSTYKEKQPEAIVTTGGSGGSGGSTNGGGIDAGSGDNE